MDTEQTHERVMRPGPIVAGALLLAVGAGLLLDTTGLANIRMGRLIAPLVLISIGVTTLLSDGDKGGACGGKRRDSLGGLWMIGLGAWLMASQTHLFGLTFGTSWPLLVILTGVMIVIRGIR